MSNREKRLRKARHNPTNVSFMELQQVLIDAGFALDHVTGSHHIFYRKLKERDFRIAIPFARPVKSTYVKQAIILIDEIRLLEPITDDENQDESEND